MRCLVLGCGNLLAADDAVGLEVVRYLKQQPLPPGTEVYEAGTPGLNLLSYWNQEDSVILVDAVKSGHPPGTVLRLELSDLLSASPSARFSLTAHGVGILEALKLGQLTGNLPARLVIIGIEIADEEPFRLGLSPAVEKAVPAAAAAVLSVLEEWN